MTDSRRLIQGNQTPRKSASIDAALGREAHREQGGAPPTRVAANANAAAAAGAVIGGREAPNETRVSAAPREAHLETAAELARPGGTVSVSGLRRLGALLQGDENLARKLAKNPRRALAVLDFISERDKQVLAGIDRQLLKQLADASDNFQVAVSKRAMAGLADLPFSPAEAGIGGGDGPLGWGGIGPPQGRGINVGNGVTVHPGGRGRTSQGSAGDDAGAPGITEYGFGGGNAGDPSVGGHHLGGTSPGGASKFGDPLGYAALGMHGEGGGISGGRLPSRAVLAGRAWKALNPGGDVSDDPESEKDRLKASSDTFLNNVIDGAAAGGVVGAVTGSIAGGLAGSAAGEAGILAGGFFGATQGAAYGLVGGAAAGAVRYLWHHSEPADPDLTGGSGGPVGPRAAARSLSAALGNEAIPNEFGTGGGPGPRSTGLRQTQASFSFGREAIPNDFGSGAGPGPRSRDFAQQKQGRSGVEAYPNDQGTGAPRPVGPSSRS